MIKVPKKISFGFGDLVSLDYLQTVFGIKKRTASLYLRALRIEPLFVGKDTYFCLATLKRILFVLSRPGAPGMLFPGSKARNNPRFYKDPKYIKVVTDELLEQAADPLILAEMSAAEGRNPQLLKQYLREKPGRPRKEKE